MNLQSSDDEYKMYRQKEMKKRKKNIEIKIEKKEN